MILSLQKSKAVSRPLYPLATALQMNRSPFVRLIERLDAPSVLASGSGQAGYDGGA